MTGGRAECRASSPAATPVAMVRRRGRDNFRCFLSKIEDGASTTKKERFKRGVILQKTGGPFHLPMDADKIGAKNKYKHSNTPVRVQHVMQASPRNILGHQEQAGGGHTANVE